MSILNTRLSRWTQVIPDTAGQTPAVMAMSAAVTVCGARQQPVVRRLTFYQAGRAPGIVVDYNARELETADVTAECALAGRGSAPGHWSKPD